MWHILGIDPTDDKKAIKKAYAAKLKTTSPEDKPVEFQALREAYEWALSNPAAPYGQASSSDESEPVWLAPSDIHLFEEEEDQNETPHNASPSEPEEAATNDTWAIIYDELESLDPYSSQQDWVAFLTLKQRLPINEYTRFEALLIAKLATPTGHDLLIDYVDSDFIDLLEEQFSWRSQNLRLQDFIHSPDVLRKFISRLENSAVVKVVHLLPKIRLLLLDPHISQSEDEWLKVIRKLEKCSETQRDSHAMLVFKMVIESAERMQAPPLAEGLNALDRLFLFTRKNLFGQLRLESYFARLLTDKNKDIATHLITLRTQVKTPLTTHGYWEKTIGHHFKTVLYFLLFIPTFLVLIRIPLIGPILVVLTLFFLVRKILKQFD